MNISDMIPWSELANHLRANARAKSGIEGAIVGTIYGFAHAISRLDEPVGEQHLQRIVTGAALGTIFGFMEHDRSA
jgi:hypothetical protein